MRICKGLVVVGTWGCWMTLFSGCGDDLLTPDRVRELLENPTGKVSKNTVGRTTDDYFGMNQAGNSAASGSDMQSGAEDTSQESGIIDEPRLAMHSPLALGFFQDTANAFCVTGQVASLGKALDACPSNKKCEVTFEVDSCMLREQGDRRAEGRLRIKIINDPTSDYDRNELRFEFDNLKNTVHHLVDLLDFMLEILSDSPHKKKALLFSH